MKILGLELKRLNRSSYILTVFVSMFAFVGVGLILSAIFNVLLGSVNPTTPDSPHPLGLIPLQILWFVYYTLCTAKRFHDLDMSGWLSLVVFVPLVNFVLGILLIFCAGTNGENKFGEPLMGLNVMGLGIGIKLAH